MALNGPQQSKIDGKLNLESFLSFGLGFLLLGSVSINVQSLTSNIHFLKSRSQPW